MAIRSAVPASNPAGRQAISRFLVGARAVTAAGVVQLLGASPMVMELAAQASAGAGVGLQEWSALLATCRKGMVA